jgi:hypothetical protein
MGIGAAFVTGLVQGFAKNIEVEKAKRLSDQQKLDTLETTLAEYRMKPADERSASGINAVAAALRGARGEVASRGRINLFGQRSPGLDIDIANMKGVLDEVDASELSFGKGDTRVSFRNPYPNSLAESIAFMGEFNAKMKDSDFRNKIREDKDVWTGINGVVQSYYGYMNGRAIDNPGPNGEILTYDPSREDWYSDWEAINSSWLNSGKAGQGDSASAGEVLRRRTAEQKNNPNILGVTKNGMILDYSGYNDPNNVFTSDNMLAGFNDIKTAFNLRDDGDVFNVWHKNIALAGVTNEVANRWFESSVKLGAIQQNKFPRLDLLRPQDIMRLSTDPREATSIPNAYNVVSSVLPKDASGQPSIQAAAHALYPYFMVQEDEPQYVGGNYRASRNNLSRTELALQLHYGEANPTGKTFGDLETALVNEERVLTDIRSLAKKTVQIGDAAAYQEFKQVFRFGGSLVRSTFTDLGFLDELGLSEGQRNAIQLIDDGAEGVGITQSFLDDLGKEMADARKRDADPTQARSDGVTYAEIASLRIGLAFKMARAADPSGRLSNQDVQQQLERLGSNFNTPEEVVRKLGVVVQEFEDRADRLRVLVQYGKGSKPMKPEERAIMEAAYSFDIMRRYGRKSEGSAAATKSYNTPLTVSSMVTMDDQPVVKLYSGPGLDATAKQDSDGNDILHTVSADPDGNPVYTPISADQLKRADQNQTTMTAPSALDPDRPPVSTGAGVVPDKDAAAMAAAAREEGISLMPSQAVADPRTQPPAAPVETRQTEEFAGLTNEEIEVIKNLRKNRYDPTSAPESSPKKSREIPDDAESLKAPPPNVVEESMYEEDETPPAPKGGIPVDDASPVGSPRPGGKFEIRMKGGSKMEGLYIIQNGYYVPAGDLM